MLSAFSYDNNVRCVLNAGINNSVTTIALTAAASPYKNPPTSASADVPAYFTLMDNPAAPTKVEIIRATGVSAPAGGVVTLTGVTRGVDGTSALSWSGGDLVVQALTREMLNPSDWLSIDTVETPAQSLGNIAFSADRRVVVNGGTLIEGGGGGAVGLKIDAVQAVGVAASTARFQDLTVDTNLYNAGTSELAGVTRITATAPVSSSSSGIAKTIRFDANYIYICTAANTWKRVALATF